MADDDVNTIIIPPEEENATRDQSRACEPPHDVASVRVISSSWTRSTPVVSALAATASKSTRASRVCSGLPTKQMLRTNTPEPERGQQSRVEEGDAIAITSDEVDERFMMVPEPGCVNCSARLHRRLSIHLRKSSLSGLRKCVLQFQCGRPIWDSDMIHLKASSS